MRTRVESTTRDEAPDPFGTRARDENVIEHRGAHSMNRKRHVNKFSKKKFDNEIVASKMRAPRSFAIASRGRHREVIGEILEFGMSALHKLIFISNSNSR